MQRPISNGRRLLISNAINPEGEQLRTCAHHHQMHLPNVALGIRYTTPLSALLPVELGDLRTSKLTPTKMKHKERAQPARAQGGAQRVGANPYGVHEQRGRACSTFLGHRFIEGK